MTNKTVHLPVDIAVLPYLQDHRFEGTAVFPAVEAMQVLAQAVKEFAPQTHINAMLKAKFDKFLFIPPDTKQIDALCSISPLENGDTIAVLQTKTKSKNAAITRIKEHVTLTFPRVKPDVGRRLHDPTSPGESDCLKITPNQIYRELVPFGPAYHNISDNLLIHQDGAIAKLKAPINSNSVDKTGQLGSPFVLDAAFHAACVWGQIHAKMVAFPVGVEKRIIVKPTQPGNMYISRAIPVRTDSDLLVFDIFIWDEDNILFETAVGVHMRDVSGGRMKPPPWIIETGG